MGPRRIINDHVLCHFLRSPIGVNGSLDEALMFERERNENEMNISLEFLPHLRGFLCDGHGLGLAVGGTGARVDQLLHSMGRHGFQNHQSI